MKTLKSIMLFGISVVLASSCFDPPEFPNTPKITNLRLDFRQIGSNSDQDSLVLRIDFQDGDGDLGLSDNEIDSPYNEQNYFLENGKLVTVRTGGEYPDFYKDANACTYYVYDSLFVPETQKTVFDNTYNVVDTLTSGGLRYYVLLDTFYIEKNPNHYNIEVEFLLKDNSAQGGYRVFDWGSLYPFPICGETFNGRFPILSEGRTGPLEGELSYGMASNGFLPLLGSRSFKIRVSIRDRALNVSNVLESGDVTLDDL